MPLRFAARGLPIASSRAVVTLALACSKREAPPPSRSRSCTKRSSSTATSRTEPPLGPAGWTVTPYLLGFEASLSARNPRQICNCSPEPRR